MAELLDTPAIYKKRKFGFADSDTIGAFAEKVTKVFGSGAFLFGQTLFIIVWILLNLCGFCYHWDPYPFYLLNVAFSTQSAYSGPLILLAQNRQESRDRVAVNEDRRRAEQTAMDTAYLTGELAGVRQAAEALITRDYVRKEFNDIRHLLSRLEDRID